MNDRAKLTQFGEACDAIIYQTPNVDSRVLRFFSQYAVIPQGITGVGNCSRPVNGTGFLRSSKY